MADIETLHLHKPLVASYILNTFIFNWHNCDLGNWQGLKF